jgi:hypothetical protein
VGSSYFIFDVSLASAGGSDMSQSLVAAWAIHLDLIPNEVGCVVPELTEPFIVRHLPLFPWASKFIHAKHDMLGFHALVKILGVLLEPLV